MAGFYSKGLQDAIEAVAGVAAAPTGTLKGAFMATSYTQNPETHQYWSDVSASIASGTTVRTLGSITVTVDTTNNRVELDFADVTETPVSATTDQFVVYMDTGVAATSPPYSMWCYLSNTHSNSRNTHDDSKCRRIRGS